MKSLVVVFPAEPVIAGKGHETTQSIRGQELPFDDRKVAAELAGTSARANANGSPVRGKP